jgi:hypothetical protein
MGAVARRWFTANQKSELRQRWRSGRCVADFARALERRDKSGVSRVHERDTPINAPIAYVAPAATAPIITCRVAE